jgi:hypothetical protein
VPRHTSVTCKLPLGIAPEDAHFFTKGLTRSVKIPEIRHLSSAFVSHWGLVLHRGILADGSAFNIRGNEDVSFHYAFWRHTIEEYAVCRWGKSLRSMHLHGPQRYLLIHTKWFNYAFWVNSCLSRLIEADKQGLLKTCILIVPEFWQRTPYVWESLKAFDVQKIIIPDGVHLFVDRLVMPETRQYTATFYPPQLQAIGQRLVPAAKVHLAIAAHPTRRIYLSRAKHGTRCVANEEAVMEALSPLGFEKVTFEELSIWQQVALMQETACFISLHGAGLSNLIFMKAGCAVIELINGPYAEAEYTFPFWRMADAMQLHYAAQFCDVEGEKRTRLAYGLGKNENMNEFLVNQNVVVDIELLLGNVRLAMGNAG